jgi:hypothetical protein
MASRVILMALLIAQLADATTFVVGEALHGIGLESNGFAVAVYHSSGVEGMLAVKGAALLVTLATLAATAGRFPRLLVWGGAVATSMGLLGFFTNLTSLLLLAG